MFWPSCSVLLRRSLRKLLTSIQILFCVSSVSVNKLLDLLGRGDDYVAISLVVGVGRVDFLSCLAGLSSFLGWLWLWMKVFWSAEARLQVARRKWDKSIGGYLKDAENPLVAMENAVAPGPWSEVWTAERLGQQRAALAQATASYPFGPVSRMELFPWYELLIGLLSPIWMAPWLWVFKPVFVWVLKPLDLKMKKLWAWKQSVSGETGNDPSQGSWLETVVRCSTSWRAQHRRSPTAREEYNLGTAPAIPQTDGPGDYSPP